MNHKIITIPLQIVLLLFIIISFSAFTGNFPAQKSYAATDQIITAQPTHFSDTDPRTKSWFIYDLPAGVTRNDTVTVMNVGKQPITLLVYPADSLKASDGGFALAQRNATMNDVGAWIKLSVSEITLAPKETQDIPFTISIPNSISKSQHAGGIVFEETTPRQTISNGMHINVISRVGVRVYENVPGNSQLGMKITDFHASVINSHIAFYLTAQDTGTVHITPTGILEVKDMFGRVVDRVSIDPMLLTYVPGKPVTVQIPTNILSPLLGWDTAAVALYYSPTKAAVASTTIVANPWITFGIFFFAILVIILLVFKNKLLRLKEKKKKLTLAPQVLVIVGSILLATIIFSWLISYLLTNILISK